MIIFIFLIIIIFVLYFFKKSSENFYNIDNINNYNNDDIYDKIDIIYYINLDHRTDRNASFLNEINKINFPKNKIKRISAIKHDRGEIGCSQSHIKILKEFINSDYKNCIIFEDDFIFNHNQSIVKYIFKQLFDNRIDYDIVMLSGYIQKYKNTNKKFLNKVDNGQTTSGYLVSKKFAKKLLENYIEGEELLRTHDKNYYSIYAIDQYWKKLQENNNWYIFNPLLGKQGESYSDIQKIIINYNI